MMGINKKNLESLVDTVVLPFERFIFDDARLAKYLADESVAKHHNLAIAKLTIYIYSDIKRAYNYIQEATTAHQKHHIPIQDLKEFYALYFVLCNAWSQNSLTENENFRENLAIIEHFVYESFAIENESKEEFYSYDSEVHEENIAKIRSQQNKKISAESFLLEGSIGKFEIQDILDSAYALTDVIQEYYINYDQHYFNKINEHIFVYAIILEKNLEFQDLGFSLLKLSQFLEAHLEKIINHPKKKMASIVLNGVIEDLITWTQSVFEEKTAPDIHYLDASLLSGIIQFEMMVTSTGTE